LKHACAQDGRADAEASQFGAEPTMQDVDVELPPLPPPVEVVTGGVVTACDEAPPGVEVGQDPPVGAADAQEQTALADASTAAKEEAGQAVATQGRTALEIDAY
jgi:hypothetical protein